MEDAPWRPVLDRTDLARIEPIDMEAVPLAPASALATVDPARCLPELHLDDDFSTWTARRDLLESARFSRDFVIETAIDGRPTLRFGDGVYGLPPSPGATLVPRARFGFGPGGNIGVAALGHIVLPPAQETAQLRVTNPLPARGGAAPEPASAIRIAAPQAFRRQERAVTAADYAEMAMRHEEVANAVAIPRWTGAWQTILVYVDRVGGLAVDERFRDALRAFLERYRLMGFDTAVRGAKSAPLDIELLVCAKPGVFRSTMAARVRDALRPSGGASGVRGFFHPDNFTFGSPVYLSRLIAAVMAVDGVQSTEPVRFQRFDRLPQQELVDGVMRPDEFEVLRLDDDPSFPERGRLTLAMAGGI
jgi:predicted phage baseplate assembly protein